jgi:hypothetical protein
MPVASTALVRVERKPLPNSLLYSSISANLLSSGVTLHQFVRLLLENDLILHVALECRASPN